MLSRFLPEGRRLETPENRAACASLVFFGILMIFTVLTMRWSKYKVNYDA